MVDSATNTSPPSKGSTTIDIEGHSFDVPTNSVECWETARQQVVWSYRAVIENSGTARDVAAVIGTLKRDGGSSVGSGGKRTAGGDEGDEGKVRKAEGRGKQTLCRDLQAQKEGREVSGDEVRQLVVRSAGEGGQDRGGGRREEDCYAPKNQH